MARLWWVGSARWVVCGVLGVMALGGAFGGTVAVAAGTPVSSPALEGTLEVAPELAWVQPFLSDQAASWSRGDLEAFCAAYAEDVTFVSPSGITRGREQVLARYRSRYPDRAAMGTLTLEVLEVRGLPLAPVPRPGGADVVTAVARWRLSYPDRPELSGQTLLVFHRIVPVVRGADGTIGPGDGPVFWHIVQDASM